MNAHLKNVIPDPNMEITYNCGSSRIEEGEGSGNLEKLNI
jgi:hypothetical protein